MTLWIALVLAVIQGVTEFLPVSSSGHLAVAQVWLGFSNPPLAFDIVLHLGTLVAVLAVYRRDVADMAGELVHPGRWLKADWRSDSPGKLLLLILIACVPTAAIGFGLKSAVEAAFSDLRAVAFGFLAGGLIMGATVFRKTRDRSLAQMGIWDAVFIGLLQGAAIFPGVSRSGATISAALILGLRPDLAARFSFLLFIPAILGATLLEARDIAGELGSGVNLALYAGSAAVAGAVGVLAIRVLLKILQSAKFHYFALYCAALGLALLV
ncbi:undecaprenyl-diphosphate phosphatase [bacterium]|nr:undecaprenyl-diphosphate phosphatase [bacterium]